MASVVLLPATGSSLAPASVTVATFVTVVFTAASSTRALMVMVARWPGARAPSAQTTAVVHEPRSLVTSSAAKLGANVSVTWTAVAVEGPLLTTSSVKVTSPRAGTTA